MIELCCEYLSVWCIWLYVITVSCMSFRMNLLLIVCLNVKELLARSRYPIWSLSDSNRIPNYNHLFRKETLKHLAKLAKWLSCVVSTYLYGAFDCMVLSCQIRVTVNLPECQGTPCSKQATYLTFKWQIHSETRTPHDNNIQS